MAEFRCYGCDDPLEESDRCGVCGHYVCLACVEWDKGCPACQRASEWNGGSERGCEACQGRAETSFDASRPQQRI